MLIKPKVKPIAIVLPIEANLKTMLKDEKVVPDADTQELSHLVHNKKVVQAVLRHLLQTGKQQGLKRY